MLALGGQRAVLQHHGTQNTAAGVAALQNNTTGSFNTAMGLGALKSNTVGNNNTANGINTLLFATASNNTADGANALQRTTTGIDETATGAQALVNNTTGNFNTAAGFSALAANTTGTLGTAVGVNALTHSNGSENTAVGVNTMYNNTSGSNNTALGYQAGFSLTTGGNNIDIGNLGVAAESNTIRIGTQGTQTKAFIAGISTAAVGGSAVVVSSTGQLGIVVSSARYKHDIHDMDAASSNLMKLRPVTFLYKEDPKGERQYGLIAEEVARLYPELVSYDADGKVVSVRYHELAPMLLNELQKQNKELKQQRDQLQSQRLDNRHQAEEIRNLSAQMTVVRVSTASELEAMRKQLLALQQAMRTGGGNEKLAAALPGTSIR